MRNRIKFLITLALGFSLAGGLQAHEHKQDKFTAAEVTEQLVVFQGQGGNVALFHGEDGAFLIDDSYAPVSDALRKAIAGYTERPVRFVFNTHWHADHTGGNENFGETGAVIVAHENVRERLRTDQFIKAFDRQVKATAPVGLPVITFTRDLSFHLNGDRLQVAHVAPAHTDGDAFVHFTGANVIHTGDIYFNGFYPFIDTGAGGSLKGMIDAADRVLALADDQTRIIPGHGPLSNRAELQAYRDMLAAVQKKVRKLVDAGRSRDEVIAAKPTADFDARWGDGFLPPDKWVGIVFDGME